MIRLALEADIPRIVELGSQSLVDGPYRGELDNTEQTTRFALRVIRELGCVLLWEEDGQVTGLCGLIFCEHPFTGLRTAQEVMWYVEPGKRSGGAGLKLLWAAEAKAKALGAVILQATAPDETIGSMYERFGFKRMEIAYQKAIG